MSNFLKNIKEDPVMYRAALYSNYSAARINLLLVVIFSVINIITLLFGTGQLLFTAAIPYKIVEIGMKLCGFYNQEYYEKIEAQPLFNKSFIAVFIIIALLIIAFYLLCWIFSKKRSGEKWLGFALAMVSADTMVALLLGNPNTWIVDMLFHVVIIILLFTGMGTYKKLQHLPRLEDAADEGAEESFDEGDMEEFYPDSTEENKDINEDTDSLQ